MSENRHFTFWTNWLIGVNVITVLIGLMIAFAGNSILFRPHNLGTVEVFFGGSELPLEMMHLKNWFFGIIGSTISGFHLLIVFIAKYAFAKKEKWARNAIASAMVIWFGVDSAISLYYGALYNVYLINIPSFLLIMLPVVFTWREFDRK
ncbi:MAG: hypothetical protein JJU28_15515 [Cyclobacteriaceae bacterium]|nr:hypothetical protein [Cyclobacteriaceae bacterium]